MKKKKINKLKLIIAPDDRLTRISKNVDVVDKNTFNTLDQMLDVMYESNGIGLAAPQVGILKRLIVMDCSLKNSKKEAYKFINPKIINLSEDMSEYEEGCLSLPTQFAKVMRPSRVKVEYINESGKKIIKVFDGLEATCIQHEMDHLEGILFIDYLSKLKKTMIVKKLSKKKDRPDRIVV